MIDYKLLSEFAEFYRKLGFRPMEVDWIVDWRADAATRPQDREPINVNDGKHRLVGSGEQGFINHIMKGNKLNGRFYTITPCFRTEPVIDELHLPQFMKLELFSTVDSVLDLIRTKECAICELTSVDIERIKRVGSDGGLDIEVDGIEVGSYGRRWFQFLDGLSFDYAYGTGLALPRFTIAENGVTK